MDFEFGEVEALETVPENFRGLYQEGEGDKVGKFVVGPTHTGTVSAILGLTKSLVTSRANEKRGKAPDLSGLSDYGTTVDEIKTGVDAKLKELTDELAKGDKAKLNLDKVRQDLATAHAADLEKANTRGQALQTQLYKMLVQNSATTAVIEAEGLPELLMPFIENQVKVVEEDGEFKVFVVDPAGDRRYSGVTGQPMTIKELVAEMKGAEKYGRLFKSEHQQGGGGMPPGGGHRPPPKPGTVLTANQKIAAGLKKQQYGRG